MEDPRSDITELEALRWDGLLDGDTATLAMLMHDDLAYTHSNGLVDTKEQFLARLTSGQLRYVDIFPSEQQVRLHGTTAVVTGHVVLTTGNAEQPLVTRVRYTAVWSRDDGDRWRHVAWHSSPAAA